MTAGRTLLEDRLGRLREAAEAARSIGLETEAGAAGEVAERIARRSGFLGPVYVMALAGGTGVGKSSILNALAGHVVSPARAVRPTTDAPVAWVPAAHQAELAPLLAWLNVEAIVSHDGDGLDDVAILDLPDMDSVRREHRATVDELLPRIDAVDLGRRPGEVRRRQRARVLAQPGAARGAPPVRPQQGRPHDRCGRAPRHR